MVGTAFLMLSLAALMHKKYGVAAVFLGLGIASNQLVALMLPLFGYYYWSEHKLSRFSLSLLVSAVIILPFYLSAPSNFYYDVIEYQFLRPPQLDGTYSLYHIFSTNFGIQLSFIVRAILFTVPFLFATFWSKRQSNVLLVSAGVLLFLAAFVLPVNGFWDYFIPSFAILCAVIPVGFFELKQRIQGGEWHPNTGEDNCLNGEN
jgi:uncharacterized membrane protein